MKSIDLNIPQVTNALQTCRRTQKYILKHTIYMTQNTNYDVTRKVACAQISEVGITVDLHLEQTLTDFQNGRR